MWQYGLMAAFVGKLIVDRDRIDRELLGEIVEKTNSIQEYTSILEGLDIAKPLSWITVGSKFVSKIYKNGNPVSNYGSKLDDLIKDKYNMVFVIQNDNNDVFEALKKNFPFKFHKLYFDSDDDSVEEIGYYHFKLGEDNYFGVWVDDYADFYYYVPYDELPKDDLGEEEAAYKSFLDKMSIISEPLWGDSNAYVLSAGTKKEEGMSYGLNKFKLDAYDYWGPLEIIKERWPKYTKAGFRRTAIIQGRPGTGKTTFCYWLAKHISNRTLIFDGEYLSNTNNIQVLDAVHFMRPDMIILNDIHYMSQARLQSTLSLFEEGNNDLAVKYIICTSNDMSHIPPPLTRPGRLGDEYYDADDIFMTDEIRRRIISGFEKKIGFEMSDEIREVVLDIYKEGELNSVEATIVEMLKRAKVEGADVLREQIETKFGLKSKEDEGEYYYDD